MVSSRSSSPVAALTTRTWRFVDEQQDAGSGVGSADTDVVEAAVDPQGDLAVGVDAVVPDAVVMVVACGGGGLGAGLVGGRQHEW
jgi:hypothetical protein